MSVENVDPRVWAGSFILADAKDDVETVNGLLGLIRDEQVSAVHALVVLARLTAEALQLLEGEGWQDRLYESIAGLSVDAVFEEGAES